MQTRSTFKSTVTTFVRSYLKINCAIPGLFSCVLFSSEGSCCGGLEGVACFVLFVVVSIACGPESQIVCIMSNIFC